MFEIGTRRKNQPPPPRVVFEALTNPHRPGGYEWLFLHADEVEPQVMQAREPDLVVWSSLWPEHRDAVIRFDLEPVPDTGTALRWTLTVTERDLTPTRIDHLRRRMNELINRDLRSSFGAVY